MPASKPPKLAIDKNDLIPVVTIHVGQAQFAEFKFGLWGPKKAEVVAQDVYEEDVNDKFRLVQTRAELAKLHGHLFDGAFFVKSFKPGQQRYKVSVTITQNQRQLVKWDSKGSFQKLKVLMKMWEIELV